MKKIVFALSLCSFLSYAQQKKDTTIVFKKRVLETTEIDFLSSYYKQDGTHSSVGGGIGSEKLTLEKEIEKLFINNIQTILSDKQIHAIIFEDYDKGCITPEVIRSIVDYANKSDMRIMEHIQHSSADAYQFKDTVLFEEKEILSTIQKNQ